MSCDAPKYATPVLGTTGAPAVCRYRIDEMPEPKEHCDLLWRIRWGRVRAAIDAGEAVGIAVTPEDTPELIDTVQNRLGFNVVLRLCHDQALWVCRPEALKREKNEDFGG